MKIDIKDLKKTYGQEIVLNNLNLKLDHVEAVALLGKSGSGKSTLLRLLSGIECFDHGEIRINDGPVNTRTFKDTIGFVFQHGNLFPHMTVLENIVLILEKVKKRDRDEAIEKVEDLLEKFGLIEHKDKYPYMLSGGQQQRLSIVRSLAVDAEIFFFDEPTSALDPILTKEVLNMVQALRQLGKKFFIVTHEVGFARHVADYVMFLDEGRIIEHGPKEILDNPETEEFRSFLSEVLSFN
jgi:polar amino acid transport system ATP-binding protein